MLLLAMAKKLDRLSSTLRSVLKAHGLQGSLGEYRVRMQWDKSVGEAIARHARPRSVRGKKLFLTVDSPAWMHQLSLMKPEIIEKLNEALGNGTIREIMLSLGDVLPAEQEQRGEEIFVRTPLTAEERERIDECVREIHDPDIRNAIRRVIEKDITSKKGS